MQHMWAYAACHGVPVHVQEARTRFKSVQVKGKGGLRNEQKRTTSIPYSIMHVSTGMTINCVLPTRPERSPGELKLLLQNFGMRDGLPGTAYHRSMQSRKAIEATLHTMITAAIADPVSVGGKNAAVLQLLDAYKQEVAADADVAREALECDLAVVLSQAYGA